MGDTKTYNINTIENAQFFTQSDDYQSLTRQMAKQRQRIARLQKAGDTEGAIEEAAELGTLEKRLDDLKENVFRLYEIFTKIEIDTERLIKAKAYFEQGQFREADAILNAEAMTQDLDRVMERDQQLDQDYAQQKADIAQHRTQLADEFLIKARLQALTYDQADWFERACEYFETALKAARNLTTVFEYAVFLQKHNCFDQAKPFYQEVLEINRNLAAENPRTFLPDVAMTLNNLANLQKVQNELSRAQASYEEALQIRRALAAENPRTFLPYVATTLINVSIFYLQAKPDAERSIALATEALLAFAPFRSRVKKALSLDADAGVRLVAAGVSISLANARGNCGSVRHVDDRGRIVSRCKEATTAAEGALAPFGVRLDHGARGQGAANPMTQ